MILNTDTHAIAQEFHLKSETRTTQLRKTYADKIGDIISANMIQIINPTKGLD